MTLAYLMLVSMFCSHSMSYENGLQLWKDCPSMQSTTGSKGSQFEITIQTFNNECKNFLSESDTENVSKFPRQRNGLDMQLTINKERANITWIEQYKNQCHRRIYMLDVEYRIKSVQGNGVHISRWCFQYNLSKGEPKQKETVTFYFDCIRTVPDREAYLINIKLWSLQQNWSPSFRTSRSVKPHCSRIRCTTSMKESLAIGPIKPITDKKDDPENIRLCQCWSKSSISLEQTTDTKDGHFKIVVAKPNLYATVIIVKVYKEENDTLPVFSVSSRLSSPTEKVEEFLTDISCENGEGTYTPVLGYDCGGSDLSKNSLCQTQNINGPSINCPVKKRLSPSVDSPHIIISLSVLAGVIATMAVTVIVFVCKRKAFHETLLMKADLKLDNRLRYEDTSKETETTNLEEDSEVEAGAKMPLLECPNVPCGSRQIMLLDHNDFTTNPVRKDCVNLIMELLQAVGIEVLGFDRVQLFRNWMELAERASKNDITEFLIIISKELVSFHNSYMTSFKNSEAVCTELQNNKEYFSCAVLKTLRDRYYIPGRVPFRIHILCLEHSDSQMCKNYIDRYSSFMIVKKGEENTFSYCFAKCSRDTKSFILDETVLPCLLTRLNGTLPANMGRNLDTTNTETSVSKVNKKLSELFENSTQSPVGEKTYTDINCVVVDLERTVYSSKRNVQLRPSSNKPKYVDRRVQLLYVRSGYSTGIPKCSQSRRKRSDSGDEIELQML